MSKKVKKISTPQVIYGSSFGYRHGIRHKFRQITTYTSSYQKNIRYAKQFLASLLNYELAIPFSRNSLKYMVDMNYPIRNRKTSKITRRSPFNSDQYGAVEADFHISRSRFRVNVGDHWLRRVWQRTVTSLKLDRHVEHVRRAGIQILHPVTGFTRQVLWRYSNENSIKT